MLPKQVAHSLHYNMQKEHYVGDVRHLIWTNTQVWPKVLDHAKTLSDLEVFAARIEKVLQPPDEMYLELGTVNAPFGIGVGGYTGVHWIALDKVSGHWLLLNSERSSYDETAELATKSLSDASTFFMMNTGLWPESSEFLKQCYSHPDPVHGKFCDGFDGLHAQISNLGGDAAISEGALAFNRLKLFPSQGHFCATDEQSGMTCWFKNFTLASKCFLLMGFNKHLFAADQHSQFQSPKFITHKTPSL